MASGTILYKLSLNSNEFKSGLSKAKSSLKSAQRDFKSITGSIAGYMGVAFSVGAVVSFGKSLVDLAGQAQGVERAFMRIADADYLDSLRKATHNTVSDMELMKRAVAAKNFDIPLKTLGNLLEFAAARAQATGQSVDYLVDSIVTGIGRKSPLILDNLGISTTALKERMEGVSMATASVGDVAEAVGKIASDELQKMGGYADDAGTKIQNIATQWENWKLALTQDNQFQEVLSGSLKELEQISKIAFAENISGWKKFTTILFGSKNKWEEIAKKVDISKTIGKVTTQYEEMYKNARLGADQVVKSTEKLINTTQKLQKITEKPIARIAAPSAIKSKATPKVGDTGFLSSKIIGEDLDNMNSFFSRQQEYLTRLTDSWWNYADVIGFAADTIPRVTDAFGALIAGTEGAFKSMVGTVLDGIKQVVNGLFAEAIAGVIAGESKKGLLGLATASIGLGVLTALWNSKVPKMATGGIVPSGFPNDTYPAMLTSGETVIPKPTPLGAGGMGGEVTFRIGYNELIGVLKHGNKLNNA